MEFCPKCGSIIVVDDKNKKGVCAGCGYKSKDKIKIQASQEVKNTPGVAVIDEKKLNTYPVVDIKCPECKHKTAYFWTMQTRSSDESETKFYKCTKCEHTWRVYK